MAMTVRLVRDSEQQPQSRLAEADTTCGSGNAAAGSEYTFRVSSRICNSVRYSRCGGGMFVA